MTRKDYRAIAKAIRESKTKDDIIERLGTIFKADNPHYDHNRFKTACEMPKMPKEHRAVSTQEAS